MPYRRTANVISRMKDNRSKILAAALDMVAEGGWQNAQMARVARRAGVSVGSVYRYFPSKAALFSEVLATVSTRETGVLAQIAETDAKPAFRLRRALSTFVSRALQGRRMAYAMIAEPCEPGIDATKVEWRRRLSETFLKIVEDGQRTGDFYSGDPLTATACLAGALMEPLAGPLAPTEELDEVRVRALSHEITETCMRLVCTPVAACEVEEEEQ